MSAEHLEFLVEEASMEAFLRALLPRILPEGTTFEVHPFQGKGDVLAKLESRLRGYAQWLPPNYRIVVVVDRDSDDCHALKRRIEGAAARARLLTRTRRPRAWQVVNRIAIEELEAWYFGDWDAVCAAYPLMARRASRREAHRDPDAIAGGTWEAFERAMQKNGYFKAGLGKIEAARQIGTQVDAQRSTSTSFRAFTGAVAEAVT